MEQNSNFQIPDKKEVLRSLWSEAHELSLILGGILKFAKSKLL